LAATNAGLSPLTPIAAEMQVIENGVVTNDRATASEHTMVRSNTDTTTNSRTGLVSNAAPISARKNSKASSAPATLDAIESYPTEKDREKYLKLTGQKKSTE
jgi:hypothetical protein